MGIRITRVPGVYIDSHGNITDGFKGRTLFISEIKKLFPGEHYDEVISASRRYARNAKNGNISGDEKLKTSLNDGNRVVKERPDNLARNKVESRYYPSKNFAPIERRKRPTALEKEYAEQYYYMKNEYEAQEDVIEGILWKCKHKENS